MFNIFLKNRNCPSEDEKIHNMIPNIIIYFLYGFIMLHFKEIFYI